MPHNETASFESLDQICHRMRSCLYQQQSDFIKSGEVTLRTRLDRLRRLEDLLRTHRDDIVAAVIDDFGGSRSRAHTSMTEVGAPIMAIRATRKNLATWMRPEVRRVPWLQRILGARARVYRQPLGSIGIMAPWNFPVYLVAGPLTGVLAAGNRAMIKPSEHAPGTAMLLEELFSRYFSPEEVSVFTGGPDVSAAFASLPFDHLVFTGSTAIGRKVMQAAAQNLVPVTLELGGKSPVIIGESADLVNAARCIIDTKLGNAGQMCIAPDYVFVPQARLDELVDKLKKTAQSMYPAIADNPDYSAIINTTQCERLVAYRDEAERAGVECLDLVPGFTDAQLVKTGKLAPAILLNPGDSLRVMQDEIFGPLLPLKVYESLDQVIDFINHKPRPLALYYFGRSKAEQERLIKETVAGGMCINDIAAHAAVETLPFGGVGPSGMGAYHGLDGFMTFSHAKAVFSQSRPNLSDLFGLRPPYTKRYLKVVDGMIGKGTS